MKANERQADLLDEAERIVRAAENDGVTLRLIGGLAIRFHCHGQHSAHFREYHDIDLFGLERQRNRILSVFKKLGYSTNQQFNNLYGDTRLQFINKEHQKSVDVLLDKFRTEHTPDLAQRLRLDDMTIPITDLLLAKLQNAKLEEKDVKDMIAILEDHDLAHIDNREALNLDYVADLCSQDWGLCRTVTSSLEKIRQHVAKDAVTVTGTEELTVKLDTIRNSLVSRKKGLRWRIRSLVGERVRWYNEVEAGEGET